MKRFSVVGWVFVGTCLLLSEGHQYVVMNLAPGVSWNQGDAGSITPSLLQKVVDTMGCQNYGNESVHLGVSLIFSVMENSLETLMSSVSAALSASSSSRVPLLITLDGQNWWESRPDLWNWFDPDMSGYNTTNSQNVEWTSWDSTYAIKIAWRNWGSQIRVAPPPNLAAPLFVEENSQKVSGIAEIIDQWYNTLQEEDRWLFIGIKVGWETSTGYNGYYYPNGNSYYEQWPDDCSHDPTYGLDMNQGLSGGLEQLGFAAVTTMGLKNSGEITKDDLSLVTTNYLSLLSSSITSVAPSLSPFILTHAGGTYPPFDEHIPFDSAFTSPSTSTPGWSFYPTMIDAGEFTEATYALSRHESTHWAASEWLWPGDTAWDWAQHFESTWWGCEAYICTMINVYNFEGTFDCGDDCAQATDGVKEGIAHLVRGGSVVGADSPDDAKYTADQYIVIGAIVQDFMLDRYRAGSPSDDTIWGISHEAVLEAISQPEFQHALNKHPQSVANATTTVETTTTSTSAEINAPAPDATIKKNKQDDYEACEDQGEKANDADESESESEEEEKEVEEVKEEEEDVQQQEEPQEKEELTGGGSHDEQLEEQEEEGQGQGHEDEQKQKKDVVHNDQSYEGEEVPLPLKRWFTKTTAPSPDQPTTPKPKRLRVAFVTRPSL
ncbi:hypothetical protein Pelo_2313 [Pelomyxa schiedti]|nr:hypothetical protein Pelo_2313 [Pelomyxa schiedti]